MLAYIVNGLQFINELLSAGIAITAFSLLLYALSFNLKDRVARTFALILFCVVVVYVGDALGSTSPEPTMVEVWLRLQWVGIIFLPPAYVHFSDALLTTTGRPSRGRRRRWIRIAYLFAVLFLVSLPFSLLVGPLVENGGPAPHLQRTWLTWVFSAYYGVIISWAWVNFWRAHQRTVTRTSQRRMRYLLAGALAPVLGSYPFLLFGSSIAANHPIIFWLTATLSNILVAFLLVVMAYAAAFFGVAWPDRVVKRRLFKWLMRGPLTAIIILGVTTLIKRAGQIYDIPYLTAVPVLTVVILLISEHMITLVAPLWERWLFHGRDQASIQLVQTLEERLLTTGDLREFLESVLAAVCDRLQASNAFIVSLGNEGMQMLLTFGNKNPFESESPNQLIQVVTNNGGPGVKKAEDSGLFTWQDYWLVPLHEQKEDKTELLGFLGVWKNPQAPPDEEQIEALNQLALRAALALEDRKTQQQVFTSLEALSPQVELIQRLRAAARYVSTEVLSSPGIALPQPNLPKWVKDALTHYWGGPKLSQSPLLRLQVVQYALQQHDGNPTNALRAILQQAIQRVRPDGERRFTADWILYNILEMKFMEGRKVREIALRLAMSEADLYRKQRVAIEAVAKALEEMETQAREEQKVKDN